MVMICHQIETAKETLKHLQQIPHHKIDDSLRRIEKLKKKAYQPLAYTTKLWDQINDDIMQLRIDVMGEQQAREVIDYTGQKRSPVEDY